MAIETHEISKTLISQLNRKWDQATAEGQRKWQQRITLLAAVRNTLPNDIA